MEESFLPTDGYDRADDHNGHEDRQKCEADFLEVHFSGAVCKIPGMIKRNKQAQKIIFVLDQCECST